MDLDDCKQVAPIRVAKNATFGTLGSVLHKESGMLVFVESERYLEKLAQNAGVAAVITTNELAEKLPERCGVAVSENPRRDFYAIHNHLAANTSFYWTDFDTEIHPTAKVHPRAYVAEKNVRIGPGCVIEPGVNVLERVLLGEGVILRAGVTAGSQGFEFKRLEGRIEAVAHAGGVRLGDRVEMQANCGISRSVFGGFSELGDDTKLDNLVHVAHNAKVGKRCFLAATAMLAGSVTIGDDVWIGPGALISSDVVIGNGASVTIGAVVTRDVPPNGRVSGNFAIDHPKFLAHIKAIR